MAHVYDGEPDARRATIRRCHYPGFDRATGRFSDDEKTQHDMLKDAYVEVERFIDVLPAGRYRALALTALEASCIWAVKELTGTRV